MSDNNRREFNNERNTKSNDNSLVSVMVNDLVKRVTKIEMAMSMSGTSDVNENNGTLQNNDEIIKENKQIKEQNIELSNSLDKVTKENEILEAKNKELFFLAYTDKKTGVMNENAFNKTFKEYKGNISDIAIILFSMCNTKKINEKQGKKYVDKILKKTAEILSAEYGKDEVYRAMGDKFYVVTNKNKLNDNYIEQVVSKLKDENIDIIYGKACGDADCERIDILLRDIDKEIKEKKNKNFTSIDNTGAGSKEESNNNILEKPDDNMTNSLVSDALNKYKESEEDEKKKTEDDEWDDEEW